MILGIDAGGTFTDFVLVDRAKITVHKVPSTPEAPEEAILRGLEDLGLNYQGTSASIDKLHIVHGSTVATNAVLQGKGAKTAFITNKGFGDLLSLARQTRPDLYSLSTTPNEGPVPPALRFEVDGRISAQGEIIEPLSQESVTHVVQQLKIADPAAVAINLLFSYVDDEHEKVLEQAIKKAFPNMFVTRSSLVLPEYKEYERGIATWLNASLGPVVNRYLTRLREGLSNCTLQIMQSSGETMPAECAADKAVKLLLSGPAGGLSAVRFLSKQLQEQNVISFDMGGTSTDVALFQGDINITNEGKIAHYPVAVPMIDMHTIGAGGGSIAYIDKGGMLRVGPQSAGAEPGPVCYGKGGQKPTVTDANLVLGRLQQSEALAGSLTLDLEKARKAIEGLGSQIGLSIEETASGIISIADEHMANALRLISVQKGYDPRDYVLTSFGGAGALHVCGLAQLMNMTRALVPVHSGVLSAFGMVVADQGLQISKTVNLILSDDYQERIEASITAVTRQAKTDSGIEQSDASEIKVVTSLDLRYEGQSYTLNLPWTGVLLTMQAFHQLHTRRYGYAMTGTVELVNVRVKVSIESQFSELPTSHTSDSCNTCNNSIDAVVYGVEEKVKLYNRSQLSSAAIAGPAIIADYAATTWIAQGWQAQADAVGNLYLSKD